MQTKGSEVNLWLIYDDAKIRGQRHKSEDKDMTKTGQRQDKGMTNILNG
jgi:hypothetical protein